MSSTNRGSARRLADYYPTPGWCTRRFLEAIDLPGGDWLEPTAGRGHIIEVVQSLRDDVDWHAWELRSSCAARLRSLAPNVRCPTDAFAARTSKRYDVVITNPPFSRAQELIEHVLPLADWVVMFLRLNFLGSASRNDFFRGQMPDVYVLPDRPSFTFDGKTDSIEYAWFVWRPGDGPRARGRVMVLPTTPLEERRP